MLTLARITAVAMAFTLAPPNAALAHTAYILPQDFTPERGAAIEAAYATQFFTPEIALGGLQTVTPEGSQGQYGALSVAGPRTTLDLGLATPGTYRITTGEMLGPVTQMVGLDGAWRPLAPGESMPEGAVLSSLQTVTLAEAYVTRGRPTDAAIAISAGRLVIRPVTHPNRVDIANGFVVQLLFDGQPFANMPLVLYAGGDQDTDTSHAFVTDASGQATLSFTQPGNYVVAVRHRADAPAGSQAQVQSFTTSLTFEVFATLPELPPEEPPRGRRRR